jgi:hypothetical protein
MDGSHPLREIADRVASTFPERFNSDSDALAWVRRLAQDYGR